MKLNLKKFGKKLEGMVSKEMPDLDEVLLSAMEKRQCHATLEEARERYELLTRIMKATKYSELEDVTLEKLIEGMSFISVFQQIHREDLHDTAGIFERVSRLMPSLKSEGKKRLL